MELDEIREIVELLKETDISEFHVEKEGMKLKIKREKFSSPSGTAATAATSAADEVKKPTEEAAEEKKLATITSPIVGIFHRAPSPEAAPFIEVGGSIKKGQVLCIVEAMKLMNEIESDTAGIVSSILIENGQPVEYGEPLFLIEPAT
ncbi:MAG: acetyl-CoA carboxylase biotin carboxyl carrier protein [Thermodesulfovibrionia bacterium]|jgi:acetyl-CoA carboxylase biotin carboxyl carrier protein|nr:acetyl-CoA carboxylase biotin carboxyl carrier protein [Thermodesulfovibrionia bacterium]